ncbi:hypothetical protein SAMN05428988_1511 [Chitinophaga sp. YR573]|uniref:hypothetical protein n=1 Tax=Chitinophaga sp. YR573 TaxID=1881040 RepID=UPI0008BC12FE|nr:hypothetical protein [Chitinophaga sp. YR573]SEW04180.1 hypothetical protein SAMN05428988_1511 [Chitinophaga sp. YR573]
MTEQLADLLTTFAKQSNRELSEYFYDNAEKIDSLIQLYTAFNRQTTQLQITRIRELKWAIRSITGNPDWKDQDELELQYSRFNTDRPLILVEGGFESARGDALGKFIIRIRTKTIQAWNYYEDQLMKDFPLIEPEIVGDETILVVNSIRGNDLTEILEALMKAQTYLIGLTNSPQHDILLRTISIR